MCDGIGSFWWTTDRLGMVPLPISLIDLTRAPIETRQPWMSRQFDCSAFGQIGMASTVAHFDCTTRSFVSIDTQIHSNEYWSLLPVIFDCFIKDGSP